MISSLTLTNDGASYHHQGTSWQPILISDQMIRGLKLTAALPGDQDTIWHNDIFGTSSKVNNIWYQLHTNSDNDYLCPKSEKLFRRYILQHLGSI